MATAGWIPKECSLAQPMPSRCTNFLAKRDSAPRLFPLKVLPSRMATWLSGSIMKDTQPGRTGLYFVSGRGGIGQRERNKIWVPNFGIQRKFSVSEEYCDLEYKALIISVISTYN